MRKRLAETYLMKRSGHVPEIRETQIRKSISLFPYRHTVTWIHHGFFSSERGIHCLQLGRI